LNYSSKFNKILPTNYFLKKYTKNWLPHSKLIICNDGSDWVLDWEAKELKKICERLKIPIVGGNFLKNSKQQSVFYTSRYHILNHWKPQSHRIAFPYFHGKPESSDGFRKMFNTIKAKNKEIWRIQVSHSEMKEIILETGINSDKVFCIPIGINENYFTRSTSDQKLIVRKKLNISENSIVVGSFQKDGDGWGKGLEPKLIKGPDIFLKTVEILKETIPELFILLTGPARGYIKNGLERLKIPYLHKLLNNYTDIGKYYNALDLYIVSSREEGGPKAILESMISGTPLVTTRVGQAMDLVNHGKNAWMVEPEDFEGLAYWSKYVIDNSSEVKKVLDEGIKTAQNNTYSNQIKLWNDFMRGFVEY